MPYPFAERSFIPCSHSEELNNISLVNCLNQLESRSQADRIIAENILLKEQILNLSSYSSKVKAIHTTLLSLAQPLL